jgi:hypothetical protein
VGVMKLLVIFSSNFSLLDTFGMWPPPHLPCLRSPFFLASVAER